MLHVMGMSQSAQPLLMAAYNNCHPILQKRSAWFVMVEPGCLCLALLQHGRWASVRTMRIGSDWHNTLAQALDREVYMAEAGAAIARLARAEIDGTGDVRIDESCGGA